MTQAILDEAAKGNYDRVIAIGGGTVIDIAKVLVLGGGATVDELYDNMVGLTKARRLIIIPTTCGTGSEATNISILNRTRLGYQARASSPPPCSPTTPCSIPEFLQSLPYSVFATSSIDALIHAVEVLPQPQRNSVYRDVLPAGHAGYPARLLPDRRARAARALPERARNTCAPAITRASRSATAAAPQSTR